MQLINVISIYGDKFKISKSDFDNPAKIQLPFYTKKGEQFSRTLAGEMAFKKGKCITIHRGNIKEVLT